MTQFKMHLGIKQRSSGSTVSPKTPTTLFRSAPEVQPNVATADVLRRLLLLRERERQNRAPQPMRKKRRVQVGLPPVRVEAPLHGAQVADGPLRQRFLPR